MLAWVVSLFPYTKWVSITTKTVPGRTLSFPAVGEHNSRSGRSSLAEIKIRVIRRKCRTSERQPVKLRSVQHERERDNPSRGLMPTNKPAKTKSLLRLNHKDICPTGVTTYCMISGVEMYFLTLITMKHRDYYCCYLSYFTQYVAC